MKIITYDNLLLIEGFFVGALAMSLAYLISILISDPPSIYVLMAIILLLFMTHMFIQRKRIAAGVKYSSDIAGNPS